MNVNNEMSISKNGLEFISKWEGCILKPYKDIAGLRTIGIGHLIKSKESFPDGIKITKEKALELLAEDVKICENAILKHIKVQLNQDQFDALVSLGFNCGVGVYTSSACKSLNNGNYNEFPKKILIWSKVRINNVLQTNQGLYNRRKSEGELFSKSMEIVLLPLITLTPKKLKEIQNYLKILGFYDLLIDGLWGPGTLSALKNFSTQHNLVLGKNPKKEISGEIFLKLRLSVCTQIS